MAINMGLTLISFLIVLISVCSITSQEHMSSEDINDILDQLIQQTKTNETAPNTDIMDTYMPSIDPRPGTNKMSRKSFMEYNNPKRLIPRMMYDRQEIPYTEYEAENFDDKFVLDNLIKKEMIAEQNAIKDGKQLSFAQQARQNQQLSALHEYPEIIIDHVTYDDDQNDKEINKNRLIKIKATHDQRMQNLVKGEKNSKFINSQKPILKTRYSIPEEEIQIIDRSQQVPMEQFVPRNYLTPEIQGLIEAIIQKKIVHDTLLKQSTESESRKQNMLLEKILQKLPDKNQPNINVKNSFHHDRLSPLEIERLSNIRTSLQSIHRNIGHHLSKPYMKSLVRNKWELQNHLLGSLRRMSKSEEVKRSRYRSLIDKIMTKMDYLPIYYDVYRK